MFEENPGRDLIDKAEELIMQIRDVQSCRIATDDDDRITEIHVVAATDRSPKMIARDVETCLKAQLGIAVDYRKIGVVLIEAAGEPDDDPDEGVSGEGFTTEGLEEELDGMVEVHLSGQQQEMTAVDDFPSGQQEARLEFLEEDARVRFVGLGVESGDSRVRVDVKLEKSGLGVVGHLERPRRSGPLFEAVAEATVLALAELLDEDFHLCLSGIEKIAVAGHDALVAAVDVVDGRSVRSFSGCAFEGRDPNEAAVLSVLDAVNRPLGRWKTRREIHYRIK